MSVSVMVSSVRLFVFSYFLFLPLLYFSSERSGRGQRSVQWKKVDWLSFNFSSSRGLWSKLWPSPVFGELWGNEIATKAI